MPSLLEEIKEIIKLPPRQRLQRIKELRSRLKWLTEKEQEKEKIEEEEIVRKSIEEITQEEEEEEKRLKELTEVKPEETLEEIAEEAPKAQVQEQQEYFARQAYSQQPRPIEEIHNVINRSHENYHEGRRIHEREANDVRQAATELYQKKQAGYVPPNERAQTLMSRSEEMLDELRNPLKKTKEYHN